MDFELADAPSDGISSVKFSPFTANYLVATSWDKTVRLYDVTTNHMFAQFSHEAAVLDATFGSTSTAYSGGLDRIVKKLDISTLKSSVIGSHDDAIKSVNYSTLNSIVLTGSWDKTFKIWDSRNFTLKPISVGNLPEKVYSMDTAQNVLIIGMANRLIHIYDLRKCSEPIQKRESSLKFQTRVVRLFPDAEGFVCGTIEGRVSVDFIDTDTAVQSQKYAFKCHRQPIEGKDHTEIVYPVNSIAFHPTYGTFASGGSDGIVNIWDRVNRKRLRQYPKYPTSISSLSFNSTGNYLAIASSYIYDEGEKDHPNDCIFVKTLSESDVKAKEV